jgi:hypothetical protein
MAQPFFASLKRWTGRTLTSVPADATVAAMDEAGVERAVLAAWHGPQGALISNDDVGAMIKAWPGRFLGLAAVDLTRPMQAIDSLRRCVESDGFAGLRIIQWLWGLPATHALYYPLYAECVRLGVPVCLQVGLTGPLRESSTGRPEHIERVALDFPELVIVCGHIGYPWHVEMIAYATKFPNVYIDTSAYKPSRYPPELVAYMTAHGRRKVLFGSNYPMLMPAECLAQVDGLGLDDEARGLFLSGNARRVFGIGAAASGDGP